MFLQQGRKIKIVLDLFLDGFIYVCPIFVPFALYTKKMETIDVPQYYK